MTLDEAISLAKASRTFDIRTIAGEALVLLVDALELQQKAPPSAPTKKYECFRLYGLKHVCDAQNPQDAQAVAAKELEAFAKWKAYPLPPMNSDGQFEKDWLHREWVAFRAGRKSFAAPQAPPQSDIGMAISEGQSNPAEEHANLLLREGGYPHLPS